MHAFTLAALMMLMSGTLHATVNAMIKGAADRYLNAAMMSFSSSMFALLLVPWVPLPHGAWGWLGASLATHIVYFVMLTRTLDRGELSAAYPIYRGSAPLLTALATVGLLGEAVEPLALAGIVCIGGGMMIMLAGRHVNREVLLLALVTGGLTAAYTVIGAQGVRATGNPLSFILWLFLLMGLLNIFILPRFSSQPLRSAVRHGWKPAALAGALSLCTFGLALYALSLGPTAELAALRETGMITATVISIFFLGERVTMGRIGAVLAIFLGAVLILL